MDKFASRKQAGQQLALRLIQYKDNKSAVVLGITRGGVIVAQQISSLLKLPLSIIIVKKLRAPHNPELAIGAITSNKTTTLDKELINRIQVNDEYLRGEIKSRSREVEESEKIFQFTRLHKRIKNKMVFIITDDGIATGSTVLAAIKFVKNLSPSTYNLKSKIILAVPVIAKDTYNKLQSEIDEIIALSVPESFEAVGQFYEYFPQVSDEEVLRILASSKSASSV